MLFTGKGDDGQTKIFGSKEKLSKNSDLAEALGSLDEANSFIGLVKSKTREYEIKLHEKVLEEILESVQNDLFIIQAQVAGADKKIETGKIQWLEEIVNAIEKELPPIKTFMIPGINEISAYFDFARTLVRRAERRVVGIHEERIDKQTLAYLNRLSSLMYAFARFSGHIISGQEKSPTY